MKQLMIVPAAGRGSRLGSDLPKVLVPVNGRPMLDHILDRYAPLIGSFVLVVSPAAEDLVRHHCRHRQERVDVVIQETPTGMLDAILCAVPQVTRSDADVVWITWCDQVAVRSETATALAEMVNGRTRPALAFPTLTGPQPYIHFARNGAGQILNVLHRREGDEMPEYGESDIGLFALSRRAYLEDLPAFAGEASPGSGTGERNFLPFIPWLSARELVETLTVSDPVEAIGVNTPGELARVAAHLQREA
jgi:bifunctional UDP-N-acetylglucosamine pyrophosphorylase / glucosamine-1-phosphate N-acetyltransferase